MITRPLDLASRLRSEPRSFDWLFFVNGGVIVAFFMFFGSRFVLAPGITVLPAIAGADAGARATTHTITVVSAQQIFAGDGLRSLPQLRIWLLAQATTVKEPVLLVLASDGVELDVIARITSLAQEAGFAVHIAAVEPTNAAAAGSAK